MSGRLADDPPHNVQKELESCIPSVLAVRDSLFNRHGVEQRTNFEIRPELPDGWSAEANTEFCTDQRETSDNVVSFMDSVQTEAGIPAHSGDCIVEARRHPA